MSSSFIHQEYSNHSHSKNKNINSKDFPHMSRFNFNSKNIKLSAIPHSLSQNKNIQNQQHNDGFSRFYEPENLKNFHNIYEKENYKKSENIHNNTLNKNIIEIKDLIGKNMNKPIELKMLSEPIKNFNKGKISSKTFGIITSYAANTNQGIVRNYNEDRVSIIINMNKPNNYKSILPWPKISYFAIFDGHAGNKCAEYLRENLLKLICSNIYFPENIPEAIRFGFEKADEQFLNNYAMVNGKLKDNSGTCGLILLIVNNDVYIGNVGDSRCIGSFNNGSTQRDITRDHKPNTPYEKERIISNGGQIYQTKTHIKVEENFILKNKILLGPYRVFPGRLSVSRTVGDAEGKIPILGGNPNVIICQPDIYKFNIKENDIDYFVLGCDGIYDQLSTKDVFKCVSLILGRNKNLIDNIENNKISINEYKSLYGNNIDIHSTSGDIVDLILKAAMLRQSYDNVTCLLVCFKNLLNENILINSNNTLESSNSKIEIYSSIKREPKILETSNSSSNYNRSNSNNKKNINIHGISKIIQKLRSGNSDSSLFKKKEEIAIANEINEYSKKPIMNIYIKNKSEKENSLKNIHHSQLNNNINISIRNNHSHNINNNIYNFREEKKNGYKYPKNNEDIQIIYKNINPNNFLYNQNHSFKQNSNKNCINSLENEEMGNKKGDIFYNRKKIDYNGLKKDRESSAPKNNYEKERRIEDEKAKQNKTFIINHNSRNIQNTKIKKSLNLNNFLYINNNSFKNIHKNEILNNITLPNNKNISSSIKNFSHIRESEINKNNYKLSNNNNDDIYNNEKLSNDMINNNFFTETKVRSNKVFHNLIKNKSNKINLFKNYDNLNVDSNNNDQKNNNTLNNDKNKNSSIQVFKAFKSIKKINPSSKISCNLKENKNIDKKKAIEYNNHKYYYSNNNTISRKEKFSKNQEKYDTFSNINNNKIIEPRYSNNRNHKELKIKYSSSQMRSNTEYNYKEEIL